MTSVIMLFIELLLDIVGLVTGGIIWAHSSESKIRKAWGMLATTLSLLLLCDNIEWMWLFSRGVEEIPRFVEVPMDHLSIPILLIVCIACCYQFFNGHYTMLKSFAAIGENLGKQDVVVRLMLFVISVLMPSLNFLLPYLKRWIPIRRVQSRGMYILWLCLLSC